VPMHELGGGRRRQLREERARSRLCCRDEEESEATASARSKDVKQHGGRDGAWGRLELQGGELVAAYALGFKRESEMEERQSKWWRWGVGELGLDGQQPGTVL
jgi:hypothetical protein